MNYRSLLFLAAIVCLGACAPTPTSSTTAVPSNRVTKFPVCGTLGYTEEPGDHDLGIYPPPPISLPDCLHACRHNETCRAVSYAAVYQLCSFYGDFMNHDQLDRDDTSYFAHYDEVCRLGKGEEDE